MLRVGLTGGIGSGKSTVAAELARHGASVVDADQIAREVVALGSPGLTAVASRFGPTVLNADGSLDRAALAAVVFADTRALRDLETITHPLIFARSRSLMASAAAHGIAVHDHPLLVEKSMGAEYHLVVVVDAPVEARVARLVGRGLAAADARARIGAQASYDERLATADVWVDNSGDAEGTVDQVERLWAHRLAPYEANLRTAMRVKRPETTILVDPDPGWAARGARVVGRIGHALGVRATDVEHIGSTAVPSLPAKDVVDVQVGVRDLGEADDPGFVAAMRSAGYVLVAGNGWDHPHPAEAPADEWRKRFYGGCDPGCVVNVHVRATGSAGHRFAVSFRDWLRADPAARDEYAAEKRRLAALHPTTHAYARAKEDWFAAAYPRMTRWTGGSSGVHASP